MVMCFSELFSPSGIIHWGIPGYGGTRFRSETIKQLKGKDPAQFLNRYVYKRTPRGISAVGFKLFYNHAKRAEGSGLLSYLRAMDGLKVIHLKRRNLLRAIVSQKLANSSGVWVKRSKRNVVAPQTIELSHDECLNDFERTRRLRVEFDEHFSCKDKLDVIFEELATDTGRVMNDVQSFLGIERHVLKAGTQRQSSRSLAESVANYAQLRESFAGTEWESMFEVSEREDQSTTGQCGNGDAKPRGREN
jgi:hypothetical protein